MTSPITRSGSLAAAALLLALLHGSPAHAQAQEPVLVETSAPSPAPWLELAEEPIAPTVLTSPTVEAWGGDSAIVCAAGTPSSDENTRRHCFRVHDEHGVQVSLRPPDGAKWLALTTEDQVIAAGPDGVWVRREIRGSDAAWTRLVAFEPGSPAIAWDLASDVLVAATTDHIESITLADGARTPLDPPRPPDDDPIAGVWTRTDGVTVAQTRGDDRATWIHRDGEWHRSGFQPAGPLERRGQWIHPAGGPRVVLSADGATWTDSVDAAPFETRGAAERIRLSTSPIGYATDPTGWPDLTRPAPPPPPETPYTPPERNGSSIGGLLGAGMLGEIFSDCQGAGCVARAAPENDRVGPAELRFFSDGGCAETTAGGGAQRTCVPTPERPSHLARRSRTDPDAPVTVLEPPSECRRARRIVDVPGTAFLLCADDERRIAVFAYNGDGWLAEGTLDAELATGRLGLAEDGTLVLATCVRGGIAGGLPPSGAPPPEPPSGCKLAIRAPEAVGVADAWRDVSDERALGIRALPGGSALVVLAESPEADRFDVVLESGDGTRRLLAREIPLEERALRSVSLASGGCLEAELHPSAEETEPGDEDATSDAAVRRLLGADGLLAAGASCRALRERAHIGVDCGGVSGATVSAISAHGEESETRACPAELRLSPGLWTLTVEAPDHRPTTQTVDVAAEQEARLALVPRAPAPWLELRAFGGTGLADGIGPTLSLRSEVAFKFLEGAFELGPLLRIAPNSAETGWLGAAFVRAGVDLSYGFDVVIGGFLGYGELLGKADADALDNAATDAGFRWGLGAGAGVALVDWLVLRVAVDFHLSDPSVLDLIGGVGVRF